jgi:hypothetical protein
MNFGIFNFLKKTKDGKWRWCRWFHRSKWDEHSIDRFAIDEIVARINQNEVSGSIKKFTMNNFHIWKFQMMIIFQSKEVLDSVKGIKVIEDVYDQRI